MNRNKKAYFSVDLENLKDIGGFSPHITEEADFSTEIMQILDLLDKYNIKATFFACYNFILENSAIIELIIGRSHDIGLHYVDHFNKPVSLADYCNNIKEAKRETESKYNIVLRGYRAPAFNLNQEQSDALKEIGFEFDSSYFVYKKAQYYSSFNLNEARLSEFPVWEHERYPLAGGAYNRLLPDFAFRRKFLKHIKQSDYFNFYMHPYDISEKKIVRSNTHMKIKMFFKMGCKKYLGKIEWIIKKLAENNYKFMTYKEDLI